MGTVTVTATDKAGNRATATANWSTSTTTEDPQLAPGYIPPNLITVQPGQSVQAQHDRTGRIALAPGTHRLPGALLVDSGTVIYLAPGARLLKDFSGSGAVRNAGIQNRRWGTSGPSGVTKVNDVWIGGPGEYSAASGSMSGNLLSLMGDRIKLVDFKTTLWDGGRHTVLGGNDCRATRCDWRGGEGRTGNGGLRFQGGRGFVGTGLYCESGDDVFQFVPAGTDADPFYGMGIEDSYYEDCTGTSSHAKLCVMGLQNSSLPDGQISMPPTSSIRRSGFKNCHAPDGTAVTSRIQNISSEGVIEDCYLDVVSTKGRQTTTGGFELLVNAHATSGGITGLRLHEVTMVPIRQATGIVRGTTDIVYEDCHFTRGTGARGDSVARAGGTRTIYRRCTFDGAAATAAVVSVEAPDNNGGPAPSQILFDDCDFVNCNGTGIRQEAGTGLRVQNSRFRGTGVAVRRIGGGTIATSGNDYGGMTPAA